MSLQEIKTAFAILLVSGNHPLPNRRMFWSVEEDFRVALVAKAMSRNRFDKIISFLHFNYHKNFDLTDKMTKLRPFMDRLNKKFMMAYPLDWQLDLDEAIIKYFGRHGRTESIRNKPVQFGFKVWCLNSRLCYTFVFNIYQGAAHGSSSDCEERFGNGGGTLLVLQDKLPEFICGMPLDFYFGNYFTGLPLINHLTALNYGLTELSGKIKYQNSIL